MMISLCLSQVCCTFRATTRTEGHNSNNDERAAAATVSNDFRPTVISTTKSSEWTTEASSVGPMAARHGTNRVQTSAVYPPLRPGEKPPSGPVKHPLRECGPTSGSTRGTNVCRQNERRLLLLPMLLQGILLCALCVCL